MARVISVLAYGYTLFIIAASLGKFVINIFPKKVENSDKIGHFIAYCLFTYIWALFLLKIKQFNFNKAIVLSLVWSILFGIFMEFCQWMFTSYRQFDYYDMLANSIGSIIGLFFFYNYFRLIEKKGA